MSLAPMMPPSTTKPVVVFMPAGHGTAVEGPHGVQVGAARLGDLANDAGRSEPFVLYDKYVHDRDTLARRRCRRKTALRP